MTRFVCSFGKEFDAHCLQVQANGRQRASEGQDGGGGQREETPQQLVNARANSSLLLLFLVVVTLRIFMTGNGRDTFHKRTLLHHAVTSPHTKVREGRRCCFS